MTFSGPTLNDALLLFAFLYSSSDIFVEWGAFASCSKPIHYWLLGSYVAVIAFRLSHYLGQYLSDDGEDFILCRQRGPPFWVNVLILGVLFPAFTSWTIVGTVWFLDMQEKTPQCSGCKRYRNGEMWHVLQLPRVSHSWFFIFWLVLCYVWILIYTIFITCNSTNGGHLVSGVMGLGCVFAVLAAVVEYRARRMESDLRILQNEDMIRRLGSSDFTPY